MSSPNAVIDRRVAELTVGRIPFVRATVVRAKRPTIANPGDTALLFEDGRIEGFVGGACADATVRRFGLEALTSGEAVLVRITPDHVGDGDLVEGAIVVGNPCLSGGELEIFLEPRLPAPRVVVLGETPIGRSLVVLGEDLGYDLQPVISAADSVEAIAGAAAVVVASYGQDEQAVLEAALRHRVPYVALVASRKRGSEVLAALDVTAEQRALVRAPAGFDIGARTASEVALSILAEVVASVRARSTGTVADAVDGATLSRKNDRFEAAFVVDPTCGMIVAALDSTAHSDVSGEREWFCSGGCKAAFESDHSPAPAG
jgi:xanthine dehydrogenase accessory factor